MAIRLTATQEQIASAPPEAKLMVLAGPGTGKTHAVIARLHNLIARQGLAPHRDILVLAFTRATVAEIRARLANLMRAQSYVDDIRFLNIRTFDSFATLLLISADPDVDLAGSDYDSRIRMATQSLNNPESIASSILTQVRHVVVDEIQDLVGVRANLVQMVLERIGGGFTLLGDPAQAIFDYLVSERGKGPNSSSFLAEIKARWSEDLWEFTLSDHFRFRTEAARTASRLRSLVQANNQTEPDPYLGLRDLISGLPSIGPVHAISKEMLKNGGHNVAILCRSNAEVLLVSARLRQQGISCVVPPGVEERGLPAWPARVLANITQRRMSKKSFQEMWDRLIDNNHSPGVQAAWGLLKTVEDSDLRDLDLRRLCNRLRYGVNWVFDSEAHESKDSVLVTTVHRAKGREYDTVVILLPETIRGRNFKIALEEARVMYVAATRAKAAILRLERAGLPIIYSERLPSGRARQIGQDRAGMHFFEIGVPGDIDLLSSASRRLYPTPEMAHKVQKLIWSHISPGTVLSLLQHKRTGEYVLAWTNPASGRPIPVALMSGAFTRDLQAFMHKLRLRGGNAPDDMLGEAVVMERVSVIVPPFAPDIHEPYCVSGLCLGLQVRGMLELN